MTMSRLDKPMRAHFQLHHGITVLYHDGLVPFASWTIITPFPSSSDLAFFDFQSVIFCFCCWSYFVFSKKFIWLSFLRLFPVALRSLEVLFLQASSALLKHSLPNALSFFVNTNRDSFVYYSDYLSLMPEPF